MKIIKVDLQSKREVNRFIKFPFKLYKNNKQWVPPLLPDDRNKLNPDKHPLYLHSSPEFFIIEDDKENMLGRIMLVENTRYNAHYNTKAAFFSMFEIVNDHQAARALFEMAFDWCRQRGLTKLIGPKGFSSADGAGILIEGFEHRPAIGITYNFPYYQELLEGNGFVTERTSLSGYVYIPDAEIPQKIIRIAERIKKQRGFWIKEFKTKQDMWDIVEEFKQVHLSSFARGYGFFPPTDEEYMYTAADLIALADPGLVKLVMKDDKIIGFLIAYHDISAGIQRAKGRIYPFGWLHLLLEKKRTKWINVNGLAVLPEYQGLGANAVMYAEMAKTVLKYGFEHADTVMVGEENYNSFSDNETMGVQWYKKHRLYRRDL